ncbi:MAG: hypothetical protein JO007_23220 [Alphaproteobacteria bacterium]|nr:hypothetical protein [Alphaproteobacteria bacterium]
MLDPDCGGCRGAVLLFSLIALAIAWLFRARLQLEPSFGTPSCDRAATAVMPVLRQTAATSSAVMIVCILLPPSVRFRFPDGGRSKTEKVSRTRHIQRFSSLDAGALGVLHSRELVDQNCPDVRPNVVTTHQSAAQSPKRENMIKLSTTIGDSETRDSGKRASGCSELV